MLDRALQAQPQQVPPPWPLGFGPWPQTQVGLSAGLWGRICQALQAADRTLPNDCHPMVNSKEKVRGDPLPNRVQIVWTTNLVEPGDKWMMVTMLG